MLVAAVAFSGVILFTSGLRAQQPAAPTSEEDRIRQTLGEPTSIELMEIPLAAAVEQLRTLHGIPIELDRRALEDAGGLPDVPVTRTLKGVSLRTALGLWLRELKLGYWIGDDVLVITTAAEAATHVTSRAYPILELLPATATSADPLTQLVRSLVQRPGGGASPPVVMQYGPLLVVRGTEETHHEVEKLLVRLRAGVIALAPPSPPNSGSPFTSPQ
jgi:hypothetical protein